MFPKVDDGLTILSAEIGSFDKDYAKLTIFEFVEKYALFRHFRR